MNSHPHYLFLAIAACLTLLAGCGDSGNKQGAGWHTSAKEGTPPPGFEHFIEQWNRSNMAWLDSELAHSTANLKKLREEYLRENNPTLMGKLIEATKEKETLSRRKAEGDYIQIKTTADIPKNLAWEDGMENPDIGDPRAQKGGSIRLLAPGSYPDTFRPVGPNSNNSFRGKLYDEIDMNIVALHPETGKIIPGLAKQWAIGSDGKTVYFKIDEEAAYSDGSKVRAMDFLYNMYICTSDQAQAVGYKNVYREMASHFTYYDEQTFSVSFPAPKPLLPYYCSIFSAAPPHFYSEFGPSYPERYQWRVPPTTGAYTIDPDGLIRGRQVTMKRVQNWWAKNKKYYRNLNNVDNIIYNFIADESKAIELFRIGELDMILMNKPELWHDRMEIPEVHNGYINRATFFTIYPRPPFGIFLNTAKQPFNDKNIRLGFQHALNIQRIIDINFRGDYQRLGTYASGFGRYSDSSIKARPYTPEKAREYFAKAGYTQPCPDGILQKPDGSRLTAEITFSNATASLANIMSQLKEDARKCGLDLRLDSLDSTVCFRKVMEKRHQSTFWAWAFNPPHPSLYQGFYSGYAYDSKGNTIPYTNNISSYADQDMDRMLKAERDARTEEELEKASHSVQQKIHDEALWVPGWTTEFARIGYWRWIRWPDSPATKFCIPTVFDPIESYVFWIDEKEKKETLSAKHDNKNFREVDVVHDQYRFAERKESAPRDAPELPSVPILSAPEETHTASPPATSTHPEHLSIP